MWWTVAKEAVANWSSHNDARQGAALAYYSVFSLGPIILIAIAVAGLESKESGLWHFARNYVLSFAAVLALGFLLLVSLLVTAGLAAAGKFVAPYLPEGILHLVNMLVSFAVVAVLFAMMRARHHWPPTQERSTVGEVISACQACRHLSV